MYQKYAVIEKIRQRPEMYLGAVSITQLRSFLSGYDQALFENGIIEEKAETLFPLPFWFFFEYVAQCLHYSESTSGWCNMILEQIEFDEEKGYHLFCKLFDSFMNLSIQECDRIVLLDENIVFHHTQNLPKRMVGPNFDIEEPLHKNPHDVYRIKLTKHTGYLILVNTSTSHNLHFGICKSKREVDQYMDMCFGCLPMWEKVETNNITLEKKLIIF